MTRAQRYFAISLPLVLVVVLFHFWGNAVRGYIDTSSVFVWWMRQWFNPGSEMEHVPLLLIAAAWLFHRNFNRIFHSTSSRPRKRWGISIFIFCLCLHLAGLQLQQTRLSLLAFFFILFGFVGSVWGERGKKSALAPLILLFLTLPWSFLADELVFQLRMYVIGACEHLAHLSGIDVVRSGTLLTSGDGSYQYDVAPACSGIRSLTALFALVYILAVLLFHSWWRRLLLLLCSIPFVFSGNVIRLYAIILAAEWGGAAWGTRVHDSFGFLVFIIVLGLSLLVSRLMEKFLPESSMKLDEEAPMPETEAGYFRMKRPLTGLTLSLVVLFFMPLSFSIKQNSPVPASGVYLEKEGIDPVDLPMWIGRWMGRSVEVSKVEREILPPDTGFSRKIYRNPEGEDILLSIVLSGKDRSSLHRPELCLVGQGWSIIGRHQDIIQLDAPGLSELKVTFLTLERVFKERNVKSLLLYYYVGRDGLAATNAERQIEDVFYRSLGKPQRWAYIVFQTVFENENETEARQRLVRFLREALPVYQMYGQD